IPALPSDRECRKCLNTRPLGQGAEARLLEPRLAGGGAMGPRGRRAVTVAMIVALSSLVVGGVGAAPQSSDESALQPASQTADPGIERKVNNLLGQMTIDEKLQQLQLLSDGQITDADARAGVGSVFSLTDPAKINHFQQVAVNESRLHIPILFAYDTIHGYRTIFPVPLGAASSFDPSVATADDTIAARETATVGIKQIYSPMVDVSHEPRWGRIAEAAGEDPYLGSAFAAARVKAAQGTDYSAPDKVVTSVKHFAAYGQPEGGREYNTTDMSEQRLRNLYLPPFKAAVDAGAGTAMCSFNAISGVPGCANHETETDILKGEWGFDGFVESDYTAVAELRACPPKMPDSGPCGHGVAADGPDAAQAALNAGTDSEMVSTNIRDFGKQLLAQGRISMSRINDAVRRILRVKFRAGLFDHPFVDQAKATDPNSFLTASDRAAARSAAGKSMVLLKNDGGTLPLDPSKSVAVIGPLGDDQHDMLGPWWGKGRRPGGAGTGREPRAERRGRGAQRDRSPRQAAGAHRRDQGDGQAVRGGAVQRPPADADQGRRLLAGDPRGLVPWRRGRQRRRRRAVRQGQPGRQAASLVPAGPRPDPDLLQPRAHRSPLRPHVQVERALPRPGVVRPAVRLRLRPQLHQVLDHQPAPQRAERLQERQPHRLGGRRQHRRPQGRRGRPALHPRPRREHLATGAPAARVPARHARAGREADRHLHPRQERLRLLRQPRQVRGRAREHRRVRR